MSVTLPAYRPGANPRAYDEGVDGLTIGPGELDGKGVYAAREFAAGEIVIAFELQLLTRDEFAALTPADELSVHSYGGQRWLYPPPARWVNHADQPSCYQDFDRCCDIALRRREPLTRSSGRSGPAAGKRCAPPNGWASAPAGT